MSKLVNILGGLSLAATIVTSAGAENYDIGQNRVFIDISELEPTNQEYAKGVLETAKLPVIFIDPDALDKNDNVLAGQQLSVQLEKQVVGSTKALKLHFENRTNERFGIDYARVPMSEIAQAFTQRGPAAISGVSVNGQVYGFVNLMPSNFDEKSEFVPLLSALVLKPADVKTTTEEIAKIIGRHEGGHVNRHGYEIAKAETIEELMESLNEEVLADRDGLSDKSDSEAREFIDMRHLGAALYFYNGEALLHDVEHATGIFIDNGGSPNRAHIFAAREFREAIDLAVEKSVGDDSKYADDILKENPDLFFQLAHESNVKTAAAARQTYQQNPTFENLENVMVQQYKSDYTHSFEGAYRRSVLKQDFLVTKPPKIISDSYVSVYEQELVKYNEAQKDKPTCRAFGTVTAKSGLNMRVDANQESEILAPDDQGRSSALKYGDAVAIHSFKLSPLGTEWAEVTGPDGRTGYVSARFVDTSKAGCDLKNVPRPPF